MTTTVKARTARKIHQCDSCAKPIKPGDRYLIHTIFPDDENYAWVDRITLKPLRTPVTLKECATEAMRYGRPDLLEVRA